MHAYRLHEIDGQLQLQLQDVPRPNPAPASCWCVRAAGLNRGELIVGHGGLPGGGTAPRPVGGEAAGEVVALGAGVEGWRVGERVMGRCTGAFAEFVRMEAYEAMAMPSALDWPQAAAVPLVFMVVYDMLVMQGRLREGETLLVAGVTSGVGVAALQAAKAIGAKVIGTSGSAEKLARLQAEGLDVGLCTRGPDFLDAVLKATGGRGADLAIDAVGGSVFAECLRAMAFEAGWPPWLCRRRAPGRDRHRGAARQTPHLFGVSNKLRTPQQRAEQVQGFKADWLPLFNGGRLQPLVDRVYPFDALGQAKACMEAGAHVGKIVLAGSADA
jgi:NADPH:quinone reductase-like Zn-dependent oxidoreductase